MLATRYQALVKIVPEEILLPVSDRKQITCPTVTCSTMIPVVAGTGKLSLVEAPQELYLTATATFEDVPL